MQSLQFRLNKLSPYKIPLNPPFTKGELLWATKVAPTYPSPRPYPQGARVFPLIIGTGTSSKTFILKDYSRYFVKN